LLCSICLLAIERMNYELFGGVKWHVLGAVVGVLGEVPQEHSSLPKSFVLQGQNDDRARMMGS